MNTSQSSSAAFVFDTYEQSQSSIRRLSRTLSDDTVANLAREVIRRLMSRDGALGHIPHDPTPEELNDLCHALISDSDTDAAQIIIGLRAEGAPAEFIYLKYLAAAARRLGDWWVEDRVNFVQVTIGTGRLIAIMHGMRHLFTPPISAQIKSAVFASTPGEDHTMGVRMAADLFRKEGWEIALKVGLDHETLVTEIEHTPTSIIGLSIGGQHSVEPLTRLVVALRICCPHAPLLVSGQNIQRLAPYLSLLGLDGVARDVDEAKDMMAALWDQNSARHRDQPDGHTPQNGA